MKKNLLILTLLFSCFGFAQTITMPSSGSTTACSGTFLDPGGAGNYADNLNYTYTICPSTVGQVLQVVFTAYSTESCCDYLAIYNGNNTSAPLIGTYYGTTSPGTVTGTSAGGCLTFVFHSDGSVVSSGWSATISCVAPPPPTIVMANGSTTACSGTFLDPGGSSDYASSLDYTYTICPSTAGAKLRAIFSSFATESCCDYLTIYDGSNTSAPSLGTYAGTTSPGTVQATPSNASGCLTFVFHSDGSVTAAGWVAALSCITPCQTITANLVSTNEAAGAGGIIRVCQGQSINFVGSGTFSSSSAGATYTWSMGNGATMTGTNINYTYPAVGSYLVNLVVTDPSGCTNSNTFNQQVQVSTTPTITTSATPATLCTNQTSALAANITMTPFTVNCTPPVSGTTFLPDGSGVSYTTSITTNCYAPGTTVTAASDIQNVCLNMEHSFLGDLQIEIICPSGQTVILKAYADGGGGTYLGAPLDDPTVGPGTGSTYCFTPSASTLLVSGATTTAGTPASASIVAGNYMPTQSFAGLIGCPLNGSWTIRVTDNLSLDNGYIFNWDVNFNSALTTAASFTPTIVSQGWVPASGLTSTGATTANVVNTAIGTPCYTYSLTDNFGCTYTQNQCITVNCTALPVGLINFEATAVNNEYVRTEWQTTGELNNSHFIVQRSQNAMNWEEVGVVQGKGSTDNFNSYYLNDYMPYLGVSYYRLIQVDFNGDRTEYDPKAVNFTKGVEGELKAYPNPTKNVVVLTGWSGVKEDLKITNSLGQQVIDYRLITQYDGSVVVDLSQLAAGVYLIKSGDQVVSITKE